MRRTVLLGLILTATACAPAPLAVIREASTTPPPAVIPNDVEATSPEDAGPGGGDGPASTESAAEPEAIEIPESDEDRLVVDVDMAATFELQGQREPRSYDRLLAASAIDVEEWLATEFVTPEGIQWDGLRGGRIAAGPGARDIPGCGGAPVTAYEDLTLYVAFYCPIDDVIVLDDGPDGLLEHLSREHGAAAAAVVLAHEYGHALQERMGLLDGSVPTILLEQQADCVAGAWLGRAASGGSSVLQLDESDVRTSLIAILNVRDPAGVDQFEPNGHGSGFDRIGAFQVGFEEGLDTCLTLIDAPLDLMPNRFLSYDDYVRGGNAPYDCAFDPDPECRPSWEFLGDDLEEFWSLVIGEPIGLTSSPAPGRASIDCPRAIPLNEIVTLCPGAVAFDETAVIPTYDEVGDFILGYLLALGWVEETLARVGSPAVGEDRVLLSDCLIGAWVSDITLGLDRDPARTSTVGTSPGDLDEALEMIIRLSDPSTATDRSGTAFDKIAAFRTGVLGGLDACV